MRIAHAGIARFAKGRILSFTTKKMEGKQILTKAQVDVMVMRMSHQVHEVFYGFEELIIVGIEAQGLMLANQIADHLIRMKAMKPTRIGLSLNKHQASKPEIRFSPALPNLNGKPVLLVDDVLNSGRTLAYCLDPLLAFELPMLHVAVLVERTYRKFPVAATITGLPLGTTLEENVVVNLSEAGKEGVYLV